MSQGSRVADSSTRYKDTYIYSDSHTIYRRMNKHMTMQMCQRDARNANENDMCLHAGAKSQKLLSVSEIKRESWNPRRTNNRHHIPHLRPLFDAPHKFGWQPRWQCVNRRRGRLPRPPNHNAHNHPHRLTYMAGHKPNVKCLANRAIKDPL